MIDTTYCPEHGELETFVEERIEIEIPPEAMQVRVRLACGHTKRVVKPIEEAP